MFVLNFPRYEGILQDQYLNDANLITMWSTDVTTMYNTTTTINSTQQQLTHGPNH